MHNQEVKGAIMSPEGSLPLINRSYPDKIVSALEVDLGVNVGTM